MRASTATPRANAASSAARISAERTIGDSNQSSDFEALFLLEAISLPRELDTDLCFDRFFDERFLRDRSGSRTRVWSMKGCRGIAPWAATNSPPPVRLATAERLRIPRGIFSAKPCR